MGLPRVSLTKQQVRSNIWFGIHCITYNKVINHLRDKIWDGDFDVHFKMGLNVLHAQRYKRMRSLADALNSMSKQNTVTGFSGRIGNPDVEELTLWKEQI